MAKEYKRLFNPDLLSREEKKDAFQELEDRCMIGGSYAPGIMAGVEGTEIAYGSPLQAYCRMKGITKPPEHDGLIVGQMFEPLIRKSIAKSLQGYSDNVKVRADHYIYQSQEFPWMIGQVDGFISMDRHIGQRGGVEIKYSGEFQRPKWAGGKTPNHVLYQVAHYMGVFPVDYFLIVIVTPISWNYTFDYRIFSRGQLQDKIIEVAHEEKRFLEKYLIPGELPDPIGSKADYEVLEEVMGIGIYEDGQEIGDKAIEALNHYKEMGKTIKMMEGKKEEYKNTVIAALKGHKTGLYNGKPVCKLTTYIRRTVDNDLLRRDGIYQDYLKATSCTRFDTIK